MLRLIVVTAHPDDEAGSFGGTLLLYHDRGVETYVICLTPGQAATYRGTSRSSEELSEMRRKEFAASCSLLKVTRGEVLNYPDGSLDKQIFHQPVGELVRRIRTIRPQVILTYGGEGAVTAHPDHSMAGLFATAAFHWAGRTNRYPQQLAEGLPVHRPQKLYYSTADFTLPGRQPISPAPLTAIIEIGPYFDDKVRAFKQHSTQQPLFELFEKNVGKRGRKEMFHLVARCRFAEAKFETDLFEDVEDDG